MRRQPRTRPQRSAEEEKARLAARQRGKLLQVVISRELDNRGITTQAAVGEAVGLPGTKAVTLLSKRTLREDDLAELEAVAARLEVQVPPR
ncbi:MAG TPA: hypothetical protein VIL69_13815 [Roseomonas sp.]|jgi:hypothetical protein